MTYSSEIKLQQALEGLFSAVERLESRNSATADNDNIEENRKLRAEIAQMEQENLRLRELTGAISRKLDEQIERLEKILGETSQ